MSMYEQRAAGVFSNSVLYPTARHEAVRPFFPERDEAAAGRFPPRAEARSRVPPSADGEE